MGWRTKRYYGARRWRDRKTTTKRGYSNIPEWRLIEAQVRRERKNILRKKG